MNTSKIIKAYVGTGTYSTTEPITQGDYGYILQIEGTELPSVYRVDFSNDRHNGEALPVYGNENGAEVPEELIATGKNIYAFYFYLEEGFGKTSYTWKIPNDTRAKTGDREPTPTQQDSIDQAISVVNEAVESADQSAQSAKEDADRAEQARDDAETAQGRAEEAQESAERAKDDAETSERNASESERKAKGYAETASEKADAITGLTAQVTTLPEGSSATASYNPETGVMSFGIPKGKDGTNGIDGDDGYSPTASVSKTGKVATITITDKTGTTSAYVEDGTDGIDGISPTVIITPITGGHRITITDADGEYFADVMDGTGNVDDVQINGSSIVVDGVADIPMPQTITVSGTTPTIVAKSGIRYVCGEVATLDFTPSQTGICDVVFTSGSTPTVVTLPSTVKFPDGAFTAEADTTYEINILDGIYGAVMAWT